MSGGVVPCTHIRARRISASVEWCIACGAYRVAAEWVLPELAASIPDIPSLTSATTQLEYEIEDTRNGGHASPDGLARAERLARVADFLSNLPPS